MPQTVTCPNCNTLLHSRKAIPAGTGLRCPGCRSSFTAPSDAPTRPEMSLTADEAPSIERPSNFGAPFIIAIAASLVLGLSVVTAAVIFALRPSGPPAQPLVSNVDDRQDNKDADKEREKTEKAKKEEEQKKKDDHTRLVARAKVAMAKGELAEAEKLYTQALDLIADDATRDGLVAVITAGQAKLKTEEADKKRKKDVDDLLDAGRRAMKDKEYAVAVRRLESANALDPSDKTVRETYDEARKLFDEDKDQKKRLTDFTARVDAGKVSMKAERFTDALKEFQAALRLMPDDLEVAGFIKQVENKLINAADKNKKQAAYANLMDQARNAHVATRYNGAIQSAEAALRLVPKDADADKLLRDAQAALRKAKAANATRLTQADESARLGKTDDARQLINDAMRAWAEDTRAEKLLRELDRLVNNAQTAQTVNTAALTRVMQAAQAAVLARDWALAVSSYNNALRLNPLDPDSAIAIALASAEKEQRREAARLIDYDLALKRARYAMTQRTYSTAVTAYHTALRNAPTPDAVILVKTELIEARYQKGMADGKRYVQARRYRDAVAAFDVALYEKPDDRDAANMKRTAEGLARNTKMDLSTKDTTPKTKTKSKTDLTPKDTTQKDFMLKDRTRGRLQPPYGQ